MSTGLLLNWDSFAAVVLVLRIPLVPVALCFREKSMMDYRLGEAELASSSEFRGFREEKWESFILFS